MTPTNRERRRGLYKIECEDGRRFVIYNAAEIANPPDHVPDKWYFRAYPMPDWAEASEPFDTPLEAERAAGGRPPAAEEGPRGGGNPRPDEEGPIDFVDLRQQASE